MEWNVWDGVGGLRWSKLEWNDQKMEQWMKLGCRV